MSVPQLIDTILINPTVNISPSYRDTGGRTRRLLPVGAVSAGAPCAWPLHSAAGQPPNFLQTTLPLFPVLCFTVPFNAHTVAHTLPPPPSPQPPNPPIPPPLPPPKKPA
jgi:hypothetical protein